MTLQVQPKSLRLHVNKNDKCWPLNNRIWFNLLTPAAEWISVCCGRDIVRRSDVNLTFAGYKKREGLNLVHRHFSKPFVARLLSPLSLSKLIRKRGDRRGKKKFFKSFSCLRPAFPRPQKGRMRTAKRRNEGEKQIGSVANHWEGGGGRGEWRHRGRKRKKKEKTDTFDIRLGLEPRSRYEPSPVSADRRH